MKELLVQLLSYLSLGGFPTANEFNPPLENEQVYKLLARRYENIPNEIVLLYTWKNGQAYPEPKKQLDFLFANAIMLPIEEAISHGKALVEMDPIFIEYFPVFTSGGGEYYIIKMNGADQGCIFYFSPAEFFGEPVKAFSGLEKLFKSVLECYKLGIYKLEEDVLKKDHVHQKQLMLELNPNCPRWY